MTKLENSWLYFSYINTNLFHLKFLLSRRQIVLKAYCTILTMNDYVIIYLQFAFFFICCPQTYLKSPVTHFWVCDQVGFLSFVLRSTM